MKGPRLTKFYYCLAIILSPLLKKFFKFGLLKCPQIDVILSIQNSFTMIEEDFEICPSEMTQIDSIFFFFYLKIKELAPSSSCLVNPFHRSHSYRSILVQSIWFSQHFLLLQLIHGGMLTAYSREEANFVGADLTKIAH